MGLRFTGSGFVDDSGTPFPPKGRDLGLEDAPEGRPLALEDAAEYFAELRRRGTGAVRLGIRWDYLEETPGFRNEAYLAYLRKLLSALDGQGMAAFLVPVIQDDPPADGAPERFLAAYRHAYRRFKNCRTPLAWGLLGGPGPWPSWIPPEEAESFALAFMERMREVDRGLVFFTERYPGSDREGFARRLGLLPPSSLEGLFSPLPG
ncbi:MAG: hypothetical protein LBQ35_02205 [Spirochaetaceae bacterium]|jgi:hypothetical protein|nr:hypothetical protein [Spirochaetaceae bacterium]